MVDQIAGQPELTPLDALRTLVPAELRGTLLPVRWLVLDTGVILNDLAGALRRHPKPTALSLIASTGAARLYAASAVAKEVADHLEEYLVRRDLDPVLGTSLWRERYLPWIRFVDDSLDLAPDNTAVGAVLLRDPTDGSTAALACTLGCVALSEDRDLSDLGLGSGGSWLRFAFAAGDAALGESANVVAAGGLVISGEMVVAGARSLGSLVKSPGGRQALAVVGAIVVVALIVLYLHEPSRRFTKEHLQPVGEALAAGGSWSLNGYVRATRNMETGKIALQAVVLSDLAPPNEDVRIARLLARAVRPMSTRNVAASLYEYERVPRKVLVKVDAILRSKAAFVEADEGRWQLGRTLDAGVPAT
jgi:hypothetical protein